MIYMIIVLSGCVTLYQPEITCFGDYCQVCLPGYNLKTPVCTGVGILSGKPESTEVYILSSRGQSNRIPRCYGM